MRDQDGSLRVTSLKRRSRLARATSHTLEFFTKFAKVWAIEFLQNAGRMFGPRALT